MKISKILCAGFEGENNSAKILLDNLPLKENIEKIYLKNDYEKCAVQIINYVEKNRYDFIIAFGQKPAIKSIYVERYAYIDGKKYRTVFKYESLVKLLMEKGYKVKLSDDAGNYLCNHVYGVGLNYIRQQKIATPYLFIHIPYVNNLSDVNALANVFYEYISFYIE